MSRSRKTLEQQVSRLFLDLYLLEQRAKAIRRELSAAALQPVGDQVIVSIHESTALAGVLLGDLRLIAGGNSLEPRALDAMADRVCEYSR